MKKNTEIALKCLGHMTRIHTRQTNGICKIGKQKEKAIYRPREGGMMKSIKI